jgi:hypothetical protein
MCLRPYQNDRIIKAIRALYFAGGSKSFAKRYHYLFPTFEAHEGKVVHEVPIHMVALVATVVSPSFLVATFCAHSPCKLYAALYEWCTGEQKIAEFSANAYLDVYLGHVNTLKHV